MDLSQVGFITVFYPFDFIQLRLLKILNWIEVTWVASSFSNE